MANDEVVGAVDATDTFVFATPSDAIITLNSPNAPFAVWEESDGSTTTNQTKTDVQSESAAQDGPAPVVFRVSSQYLIQASPVFKVAFRGGWKEGSQKGGCNEISAEDWDVEAMSLVLNIIHARTKSLPKIISLELLCKFLVLVDYYKLHDALHFFATLWIDALRSLIPAEYGRDLISLVLHILDLR